MKNSNLKPGEMKIVMNVDGEIIESPSRPIDECMSSINTSITNKKYIEPKLLEMMNDFGNNASEIANSSDEEYIDNINITAPFCDYARLIHLDLADQKPVATRLEKVILSENKAGITTMSFPDGTASIVTEPVIIGSEERALGIFVPFTVDPMSARWVSDVFGAVADRGYENYPTGIFYNNGFIEE